LKHHIFIIGSVWVEPKSSAAGSRMLQLIHTFLSQEWKVTFGTVSQKNPNSIDLKELGVDEVSLELNNVSFDDFIQELNPTVVLFDRFITEEQFGWRVAEHCPNALRILDTEDLHCLRKTRHEAIKKGIDFSNDLLLNSDIAKREIAAIYRCDLSLIISSYEMTLLQEVFKIDESLLFHLPFFLNQIDKEKEQSWKPFEDRNHFVSIGNFLHAPNVDATIQLKKIIWKKIREQLPKSELRIYGAYPTQQVLEFTNKEEGFYVHGFAEDANEVTGNAKVLLAPLRFGAGIKGKLTDAMLNGTPSVTTSIGVEGMSEEMPWNGFVEDDFDTFSQKAVALFTNKDLWNKAQQNGVEIINTLYGKDVLENEFLEMIQNVSTNLHQHRNLNFTGKMLLHHSLQSSKYMSKWIEEKNKE
jgi:glycosyltransferase involved in cell wall biosynthesis